jgi:16S rRNA (cytidine1402-2'-O)-methyltransferase
LSGVLRIVSTPIGNLEDLSPRAAAALRDADLVVCEDTRVTRKLLTRLDAHPRVVAVHARNEQREAARIAQEVARGAQVALVTDAGTPGVSDPGRRIVSACREAGQRVEAIPGPSAALAALVASGLPSARFSVEGFLPQTGKARRRRLDGLASERRTMVIFEAPHRIADTLKDMANVFGSQRRAALARELTKIHEEIVVSSIGELLERVNEVAPRGECTLVIEGAAEEDVAEEVSQDLLLEMLSEAIERGATKRDAVAEVAQATGAPRRVVFDLATTL